jgi:hypothetical protein
MIAEAIEKIIGLKRPEKIEVGGFDFVLPDYNKHTPPRASSLTIHTLAGIGDFIESHKALLNSPVIHVVNSGEVRLFSLLDEKHRDRENYCTAKLARGEFDFGSFLDLEKFMIGIQANFEQDEMTALIQQKIGTIVQDANVAILDDGISQATTIKTGIAGVANVVVPNPVTLRPHRTFSEVEQPASAFVLRIKEGGRIALFEADGGSWGLEAIKNIAEWLEEKNPGIPVIA